MVCILIVFIFVPFQLLTPAELKEARKEEIP